MKVFLDTVGCRLNQSEIETFARQFRAAGHILVAEPGEAELVVVNTCAVTAAAASDSRQKIRQAAHAGAGEIVVTGCWSTLNPGGAAALPGVSQVIPNPDKDHLVGKLLHISPETFDQEMLVREPIPGARLRTRAFIKVQDGCDNRCTFCVTTVARGASVSRPTADVLADVQAAAAGGAQEVVLTGVHLGSWGQDLSPSLHLASLVKSILLETDMPRIRLSSLEPWDLEDSFFALWENPRLCRHLHLPLQSGSASVLRRMARKTTPDAFAALVAAARRWIPEVALTTDVIAGFPGETEAEFAAGLAFIRSMRFSGGHVFTYSARPGTAAARMPNQVPVSVRKARNAQLRAVFSEAQSAYQQRFVGQELDVLWESAISNGPEGWQMSGLTDNYLRVTSLTPKGFWNRISPVHLDGIRSGGLHGTLVSGA